MIAPALMVGNVPTSGRRSLLACLQTTMWSERKDHGHLNMSKKTVSTSELKARCAEVIDGVTRGGGPVVITKRGRPVAEIVPVTSERHRLYGCLKGAVTILGDIVEPVDVTWEASG